MNAPNWTFPVFCSADLYQWTGDAGWISESCRWNALSWVSMRGEMCMLTQWGSLKGGCQVGYTVFFSNSLIYWKSIVWLASQYNALSGLRYTLERFILQTVHYSACYMTTYWVKKIKITTIQKVGVGKTFVVVRNHYYIFDQTNASLVYGSFCHWIKNKKGYCNFLSHNSDFFSCNCEFLSCYSDFITRNCKFISHNSEKKVRIAR